MNLITDFFCSMLISFCSPETILDSNELFNISNLPPPVNLSYDKYEPINLNKDLNPILMIHGIYSSKQTYQNVAQNISDSTNRTVYALSMRDHKFSPSPPVFDYESVISDLIYFLKLNNIDKFELVGHSLGGLMSGRLATLLPEKIERLVLIDIDPKRFDDQMENKLIETFKKQNSVMLSAINTVRLLHLNLMEGIAKLRILLNDYYDDKETVMDMMENLHLNDKNELDWVYNVEALTNFINTMKTLKDFDCKYNGNVLLIYGKKSHIFNFEEHEKLVRYQFPNVVFKGIENAGHTVFRDNRKQFLNYIIPFLNSS